MNVCDSCGSYKYCSTSGYDFDFIRRIMIASSIVSYKTVYITHLDDAESLGYELKDVIDFVAQQKKNCYFFSSDNLRSETKEELVN